MAVNNSIIAFAVTDNSLKVITSDPMNLYGIEVRPVGGHESGHLSRGKGASAGAINYYYSEVSARMAARTANRTAEEQVIEELNVEGGRQATLR